MKKNGTESLISIVIPTYNKAKLAIETLNSVLAQTYTNWECIVVDDGSNYENYKLLEDYISSQPKIALFKRPKEKLKGANACRNYGLSLCKGNFVQFFDSDDLMLKTCLEYRVEYLKDEKFDFIVFKMSNVDSENFNEYIDINLNLDWEGVLMNFIEGQKLPWNLQRVLFKKDIIENGITFNEKLKRFQDIEFHIKLLVTKKPVFKILTQVDCLYRRTSENNPRSSDFFKDVFQSIPVFLNSIIEVLPNNILKDNKRNLQIWLYNVISLYTVNELKSTDFKPVISAARKYLNVSSKQILILNLLFFGKRNLNRVKGKTRFFNLLNTLYIIRST